MDRREGTPNGLIGEQSPYLLQHAHNPVNWLPWGDAAFQQAKIEDKPIFLSIGYSTCHWCHVMARESFEDAQVARMLNAGFVPVKVDREERPDVDAVYMNACMAMNGSGGWPLTAFLAPDLTPFHVATYLPKTARYGQAGLIETLEIVSSLWRDDRMSLLKRGAGLKEHLARFSDAPEGAAPLSPDVVKEAADGIARGYVKKSAAFGSAPLFPMPHRLIFLLLEGRHARLAQETLLRMARGGIFDHLGGGFARYSTDDLWLVPHFEKMLYDNALLAYAYAEAYARFGDEFCARVAADTLDYVLREMTDAAGGFYCAQDADSGGREGKFYTFARREVLDVLGEAGEAFCARYDITPGGNFEGENILNLLKDEGWRTASGDFAAARAKLYAYRAGRHPLHKDDKVLASWNGLMIAALSRAGAILHRQDYLAAADRAAGFFRERMIAPDGTLRARYRAGEAGLSGTLDDYALLAWGYLEHYRARLDPDSLSMAAHLAGRAYDLFADPAGGYFLSSARELILRPKETYDGPIPSGNGAMALALSLLRAHLSDPKWDARLNSLLDFLSGGIARQGDAHCFALIALLELFSGTTHVVAACADGAAAERAKRELLARRENLHPVILSPETRAEMTALDPTLLGYPIPDAGVKWYVCRNGACAAPADELPN